MFNLKVKEVLRWIRDNGTLIEVQSAVCLHRLTTEGQRMRLRAERTSLDSLADIWTSSRPEFVFFESPKNRSASHRTPGTICVSPSSSVHRGWDTGTVGLYPA